MKTRRILALVLSVMLSLNMCMTALATDVPVGDSSTSVTDETVSSTDTDKVVSENDETQETDESMPDKTDIPENQETKEPSKESESLSKNLDSKVEGGKEVQTEVASTMAVDINEPWNATDFTYGQISETLLGCNYTREMKISGLGIMGLSESGQAKIAVNKHLVIPSIDPNGITIVGIGSDAFKQLGIEMLTLPENMMIPYDDTVTHTVTERGNFLIQGNAFYGNKLRELNVPRGVIFIGSQAFARNKLRSVTFPHTVWMLGNSAFSSNQLTQVNFPTTVDFQLQIDGGCFSNNKITSVRLPDYTEKVDKRSFSINPGMEAVPDNAPEMEKKNGGIVYMYTSNPDLFNKDRIHHIDRSAESQFSWHQKLVMGTMPEIQPTWTTDDFTYNGSIVTGLSETGIVKRATNKDLIIPDKNPSGEYITEIADAKAGGNGLFGTPEEKINSVILPLKLERIGNFAFQNNNLVEIDFPSSLEKIGNATFQTNKIKKVSLPNSVTLLGGGAFASNATLESVILSKGLTEIPATAFGNIGTEIAEKFTSISIPSSITKIGNNAFVGASFKELVIPGTVKEIGTSAFAQTDNQSTLTKLTLGEGLEKIGNKAFAFANLTSMDLPSSVTTLHKGVFTSNKAGVVTVNTKNAKHLAFQVSGATFTIQCDWANIPYDANDFIYDDYESQKIWYNQNTESMTISGKAITGLSETGVLKLATNKELVIPAVMPDGTKIVAIANNTFKSKGITSLIFPEGLNQFVIGSSAFASNELTTLAIPEGVCYVDTSAFTKNKLTTVTLPATLIDCANSSFATNSITTLNLPQVSKEIGLQFSALAFAKNQIKYVNLPNNMDRVDKNAFLSNPGMEESARPNNGIVYLFTTQKEVLENEAIPDGDYHKKYAGTIETYLWNANDFTYEGTSITGLSESGVLKRIPLPDMVMPDKTPTGENITAIKDAEETDLYGLFAAEGEVLKSVKLPIALEFIGNYAFQGNPIKEIDIPESITIIGAGAFAGNEVMELVIPSKVLSIGGYAFAQSKTSAQLSQITLSEGLTTIGDYGFKNSKVESLELPYSVTALPKNVFYKEYTGYGNTKIIVQNAEQVLDKENYPESLYHTIVFDETQGWSQHDFIYEGTALTGLSKSGELKRAKNRDLILPDTNPQGEAITEIGNAVAGKGGTFGAEEEVFDSVRLPATLQKIGDFAFQMNKLTEIVFPSSVTTIGKIAFQMNALEEVILPDSVTFIGEGAFASNTTLKKVRLSAKLTNIPATAFGNAGKVAAREFTQLEIPEGVETIGANAFAGAAFTEVVIPKTVRSIGNNTFGQTGGVKTLKTVKLSEGLQSIGKEAFKNTAIEEIVIPLSLQTLDKSAFRGGKEGLVKVITNNSAHKAFQVEQATFEVIYEELLEGGWTSRDFTYEGNIITGYSESGNEKRRTIKGLTLPDENPNTEENITVIGEGAFKIPDGEWEQGKIGVESPYGKESVILPKGLEKIEKEAFRYNNLGTVNFPTSTYSIGESAFNSNKITTLVLPDTITEVQNGAFSVNDITELRISRGLTELNQGVFSMNINMTSVEIPDTIKSIGEFAFAGAALETLNIPTSVKKIGKKAFHLHHLTELRIPGNVKEIGESAFEGTFKFITLKNLVIEEGVETIGALAFKEGYLESVELPSTIKSVASDAFFHNAGTNNDHVVVLYTSSIEHMNFPSSLSHKTEFRAKWTSDCFTYGAKKGRSAFTNNLTYSGNTITGFSEKGLEYLKYTKEVVLPETNPQGENITRIAKEAFANMQLTKVVLPKFLEVIEERALVGNELQEVELPNTILEVASNAFADNKEQVKLIVTDKDVLARLKDQLIVNAVVVDRIVPDVPTDQPTDKPADQPVEQPTGTGNTPTGVTKTQKVTAVKTGDETPIAPLIGISACSLLLLIALVQRKKRQAIK